MLNIDYTYINIFIKKFWFKSDIKDLIKKLKHIKLIEK